MLKSKTITWNNLSFEHLLHKYSRVTLKVELMGIWNITIELIQDIVMVLLWYRVNGHSQY